MYLRITAMKSTIDEKCMKACGEKETLSVRSKIGTSITENSM
jgi:hypothetical protein